MNTGQLSAKCNHEIPEQAFVTTRLRCGVTEPVTNAFIVHCRLGLAILIYTQSDSLFPNQHYKLMMKLHQESWVKAKLLIVSSLLLNEMHANDKI